MRLRHFVTMSRLQMRRDGDERQEVTAFLPISPKIRNGQMEPVPLGRHHAAQTKRKGRMSMFGCSNLRKRGWWGSGY